MRIIIYNFALEENNIPFTEGSLRTIDGEQEIFFFS